MGVVLLSAERWSVAGTQQVQTAGKILEDLMLMEANLRCVFSEAGEMEDNFAHSTVNGMQFDK